MKMLEPLEHTLWLCQECWAKVSFKSEFQLLGGLKKRLQQGSMLQQPSLVQLVECIARMSSNVGR